jgi:hypothetical protein
MVGLGSLAAGGAAAMGSGAFAVEARNREGTGTVMRDDNAYLQLKPNGKFSRIRSSDGELEVTLQRLNGNSVTELDDIFYVRNGGQDTVNVKIDDIHTPDDVSVNRVFASSGQNSGNGLSGGNGANLNPGQQVGVGIEIDIGNSADAGESAPFTFSVDADSA